jgi:hypothetical protein
MADAHTMKQPKLYKIYVLQHYSKQHGVAARQYSVVFVSDSIRAWPVENPTYQSRSSSSSSSNAIIHKSIYKLIDIVLILN